MRKIVIATLCACIAVTGVFAQQKRVYTSGTINYAPSAARFVLSADEMETNLDQIQYSINGGETMVYEGPIRVEGEGRHTITYRATDVTGNLSADKVYTVVIDDTAPMLSATAKGQAYIDDDVAYLRGDTEIILSASDELSGVYGIYVSLDNRNFFRYEDVAYIDEEGEHQGYAYTEDNVGNRSQTFTVRGFVDNTPPDVRIVPRRPLTVVQGDRYTSSGNQFVVRARDELSGVAEIHVSIDRQEYITYAEPVVFDEPGFHIVRARAVDRLGNVSSVVELDFYVDVETPEPEIRTIIEE
jgi:hypothetical protein